MYKPLLAALTPDARQKLLKGNYQRIFDKARINVRNWEKLHVDDSKAPPPATPVSGAGK
jgi:hypothetical protein